MVRRGESLHLAMNTTIEDDRSPLNEEAPGHETSTTQKETDWWTESRRIQLEVTGHSRMEQKSTMDEARQSKQTRRETTVKQQQQQRKTFRWHRMIYRLGLRNADQMYSTGDWFLFWADWRETESGEGQNMHEEIEEDQCLTNRRGLCLWYKSSHSFSKVDWSSSNLRVSNSIHCSNLRL